MNIYAGVEEELRVISLSNFGYYSNKEQMHKKDVLSFFNSVNEITNHVSCTTYQHDIFIDNGSRVNIEVPQFEPEISTPELVLNDNPLSHKLFISQILANRLIVLKAIDNLKRKGVNLDISLAAVLPWLHNSPNGMGEHLHLSSHYSIPERTLNSIFLTLICTDPSFCGVGAPSTNLSSGGFEASAKVRTHNAFSSDLCQSRKPLLSERNRYDLPADWCYFKVVNLEAAKSQRQMLLSCLKKAAVLFLIIQGADFSGFSNFLPIAPVEDVKKFSFDLFGNSIRIPFKDGNSYTWLEADEKYYNLANDYAKKNKSAPHWFKWTIKEWEYWRNIYLTKDYEKLSQISDKGIKLFLLFNPILAKEKLNWVQIRDAGAIAGIIKNSIDVLSIPVNWYDNLLSCKSPKEFCKYYLFKPTFEYIDMLVRKGPLKTWATLTYAVKVFFKISVIDFRYSFIRSNGIFESLDKKGYLNHKVVSEKEISKRMKTPQPDSIRAMFRASMIKLYHDSQDAICGWEKFSVGENTYKMPTPDCSFPNFKKTKFKKIIKKIYLFLNCLKVLFFK